MRPVPHMHSIKFLLSDDEKLAEEKYNNIFVCFRTDTSLLNGHCIPLGGKLR